MALEAAAQAPARIDRLVLVGTGVSDAGFESCSTRPATTRSWPSIWSMRCRWPASPPASPRIPAPGCGRLHGSNRAPMRRSQARDRRSICSTTTSPSVIAMRAVSRLQPRCSARCTVLGRQDQMTPPKAAQALVATLKAGCTCSTRAHADGRTTGRRAAGPEGGAGLITPACAGRPCGTTATMSLVFPHTFVPWFRAVAPYIHAYRGKTFRGRHGWRADRRRQAQQLREDLAILHAMGIKLVLVHGFRPQTEQLAARARSRDSATASASPMRGAGLRARGPPGNCASRSRRRSLRACPTRRWPMPRCVVSGNFLIARPVGIVDGVDFMHSGVVRRVTPSRSAAPSTLAPWCC